MSLNQGNPNNIYKVEKIIAKDNLINYLGSLGIIKGNNVKVINHGPMGTVVRVKNATYAIDNNTARRIIIVREE